MTDTWTILTSTGTWAEMPPTAFQMLIEDGRYLLSETRGVFILDYTTTDWTAQSNGTPDWTPN